MVYLEALPAADEGSFLLEERVLLEVVAGRLSRLIKRRENQEELRRQRDLARDLLEGTQALMLLLDEDGRVLHYNKALVELTGVPLAGVRLQDFCALFLPSHQAEERRPYFTANGNGASWPVASPTISTRSGPPSGAIASWPR